MDNKNYSQITLTDFGIREPLEKGRYLYEEDLSRPDQVDWLGFGPGSISLIVDKNFEHGVKMMTPSDIESFKNSQSTNQIPWTSSFIYEPGDDIFS